MMDWQACLCTWEPSTWDTTQSSSSHARRPRIMCPRYGFQHPWQDIDIDNPVLESAPLLSRATVLIDDLYLLLGHADDVSNARARVHSLKALVDLVEGAARGDVLVDLERPREPLVDDARQFAAALDTAESAALPLASGDKLERPCADLLASSCDADDGRDTPALVARLEGLSHDGDVARAVEGVVASAVGHLDELLHDALPGESLRVDKVGGAHLLGPLLLVWVGVNCDDLASLVCSSSREHGKTDTSDTEDGNVGALLDLGGLGSSTVSGGDATTQQACGVERSLLGDGDDGVLAHDGVLGEGRGSHEVVDILSLGRSDGSAKVGLAALAELALFALGGVERDDMVSDLDIGDALTDAFDDTAALVSKNAWKLALAVVAREGVCVGVAHDGVLGEG